MKILGVIPARMASSRFPDKPMKPILGMPMIEHVWRRSKMARTLTDLFIATCDRSIESHANKIGADCIMTLDTHTRCTDRVAEALLKAEKQKGIRYDIVVVIQGDEPMTHPDSIDRAVQGLLDDPKANVVNLWGPIESEEELNDVNEIKVVLSQSGYALYFSRSAIPCNWKNNALPQARKQICVMPFRREALLEFNELPETHLERIESVDMMRLIESDRSVKMIESPYPSFSVDTPEDLQFVEKAMATDLIAKKYLK